jgi:glycosyltransferase involved in cell wall biosynthesis
MKVLHITASMSPEWGGPVKVVQGLTEALAKKNIEVSIFAPVTKGKEKETILPERVDARLFPQDIFAKSWRNHSFALKRELKREISNFDLIHIHEIWHHSHFVAARLAKRFRKPYIITIHGELEPWCLNYKALKKKVFSWLFQKRILENASMLHAITEEEVKNIRRFGVNNTSIVMIPNGINLQEFQNLPSREELTKIYTKLRNKEVILFLGRIHPKKGLDLFAKAFGKIAKERKDICLLIVGPDEGGYQAQIEKLLEEGRVLNKVIFTGMLTGYKKLVVLSGVDIFVLPSYSEGFSMTILEAMICGLPVIITHQCNFPEVTQHNAGIIINPEMNELAEAMIKLLENPSLAEKMGENGKKLILEKFTWDRVADRMIETYNRILKK